MGNSIITFFCDLFGGQITEPTKPTKPDTPTILTIKDGRNFTEGSKLIDINDSLFIDWIKKNIFIDGLTQNISTTLYQCNNKENTYIQKDNIKYRPTQQYTFYILETDKSYICFKSETDETNLKFSAFDLSVFDNESSILIKSNDNNNQQFTTYYKPINTKIFCTSNAFIFKNNNKYIFNTPDQNLGANTFNYKIKKPGSNANSNEEVEKTTIDKETDIDELNPKTHSDAQNLMKKHNEKLSKYVNDLQTTKNYLEPYIIRDEEIMFKYTNQDKYIFCTTNQSECTTIDYILFNLTYINDYVLSDNDDNDKNRIKINTTPDDKYDKRCIYYNYTKYKINNTIENTNYSCIDYTDKPMYIGYKINLQLYYFYNSLITEYDTTVNMIKELKTHLECLLDTKPKLNQDFINDLITACTNKLNLPHFTLQSEELPLENFKLQLKNLPIRLYLLGNSPFQPNYTKL